MPDGSVPLNMSSVLARNANISPQRGNCDDRSSRSTTAPARLNFLLAQVRMCVSGTSRCLRPLTDKRRWRSPRREYSSDTRWCRSLAVLQLHVYSVCGSTIVLHQRSPIQADARLWRRWQRRRRRGAVACLLVRIEVHFGVGVPQHLPATQTRVDGL